MSIFCMLEWSNSTRKRVQWPSFFGFQDIEYPKCSMYWVCSPTFTPKNRANLGNCMELSLPYPIWFKWIQDITALIHINPYKSKKTHWKKHMSHRGFWTLHSWKFLGQADDLCTSCRAQVGDTGATLWCFLAPEDGTIFSHDEHGMEYLPTIVYINR